MLKRYITILVLSIVVVIFAVQNVGQVDIQLLMLTFHTSLSLIIILTFFIGALLTLALAFYEIRKRNRKISDLTNQIKQLENEPSPYQTSQGEPGDSQS